MNTPYQQSMDIFLIIRACKNCMICECLIKTLSDLLDWCMLRWVKIVSTETSLTKESRTTVSKCTESSSSVGFYRRLKGTTGIMGQAHRDI
jgi:hypothetical protein